MSEYAVVAGMIQFDPKEREANGQSVRDITIKALGTQKLVRITVWPEFSGVALKKGDFVSVDGKYEVSMGQGTDGGQREYINVSATQLAVLPAATKAEREVSNRPAAKAASDDAPIF